MNILLIIYYITLFLCLIKALGLKLKYKNSSQNFFLYYFFIAFILESYGLYKIMMNEYDYSFLFNYFFLFNIVYFLFQYNKEFQIRIKTIASISASIASTITIYLIFNNTVFSNKIGLVLSFFYILLSLLWFYQKNINISEEILTELPFFWISIAILLWSVFFIFRIMPMYILDSLDTKFKIQINNIFMGINIITYLLLLISLFKFQKLNERSA